MLADEIIELPWSNIYPGQRMRWATPRFVKRGTILRIKGQSMRVQLDGHAKPTVIPDAKWYFVEGRKGNMNEHLFIVTGKPLAAPRVDSKVMASGDAITPHEAANILGVDTKALRRMIRAGKVPAVREGGRWVLSRSTVQGIRR